MIRPRVFETIKDVQAWADDNPEVVSLTIDTDDGYFMDIDPQKGMQVSFWAETEKDFLKLIRNIIKVKKVKVHVEPSSVKSPAVIGNPSDIEIPLQPMPGYAYIHSDAWLEIYKIVPDDFSTGIQKFEKKYK